MADTQKALETMIRNIEAKTGQSMAQLTRTIQESGLAKHGAIREMLMERFGLGHGAATSAVHLALNSDGESAAKARGLGGSDVLVEIYADKKAHLRPIHDKVLGLLNALGPYEAAPKKGYVSYRLKKQFAMVGPKTNTTVEIGFGAKSLATHARLKEMPPNSMCRYTTRVESVDEVDQLVESWIAKSYVEAG